MNSVTTEELIHINELARTIKQKDFIVLPEAIVGMDNFGITLIYTESKMPLFMDYQPVCINTRALGAFLKTVTIESKFDIKEMNVDGNRVVGIESNANGVLPIKYVYAYMVTRAYDLICQSKAFNNVESKEITDIADAVKAMHAADGALYRFIDNHFVTIFSGLLPMNKADKLYVQIIDSDNNNTFKAKYTIKKKSSCVYVMVMYRNV